MDSGKSGLGAMPLFNYLLIMHLDHDLCVITDLQVADIGDLKLLQEYGVGNALQHMHRNTVQPSTWQQPLTQQHTNEHLHITCNTSQPSRQQHRFKTSAHLATLLKLDISTHIHTRIQTFTHPLQHFSLLTTATHMSKHLHVYMYNTS